MEKPLTAYIKLGYWGRLKAEIGKKRPHMALSMSDFDDDDNNDYYLFAENLFLLSRNNIGFKYLINYCLGAIM